MSDEYKIGICSESVTVHVAVELMLRDQVTVDGRAVSVARFDPSEPWQGLVIDAWGPCQQVLAYDLSQAHAIVLTPSAPLSWFRPLPERMRALPRYKVTQPRSVFHDFFGIRCELAPYDKPMGKQAITIAVTIVAALFAVWFYFALR